MRPTRSVAGAWPATTFRTLKRVNQCATEEQQTAGPADTTNRSRALKRETGGGCSRYNGPRGKAQGHEPLRLPPQPARRSLAQPATADIPPRERQLSCCRRCPSPGFDARRRYLSGATRRRADRAKVLFPLAESGSSRTTRAATNGYSRVTVETKDESAQFDSLQR